MAEDTIKVTIKPKEATEICNKALLAVAVERGIDKDKPVLTEQWFVNCKRKGIVFRGTRNGNTKLIETEPKGLQGIGAGKYVSKGYKK